MKIRSIVAATALAATTAAAPAMAQVTSVTQLRDVQPTDWSYQAISNLISRYGCLTGYPNGTFRPGQSATRAELAALTSACLERIGEFQTAADAQLASALRAEFSKEINATNSRISALELESARKAQGVGNYVGAGVLLNRQGVDGNGYDENRTILGATIQSRYTLKTFANQNSVSIRPYVNFAASPSGKIGSGGGALVSYDLSLARSNSGVSKANLYLGAGYQVPFVNNSNMNFQSAIGEKGQAVFVVGMESRLNNALSLFGDIKFPTTNAANSYGVETGTYSPVGVVGVSFKL